MVGVDSFVQNNFNEYDSKFDSCINAIIYGYKLLEKDQSYSREEIKNTATKVRGKVAKSVELEDFLRNDLIVNYIEPYRSFFDLKHYLFQSGVEEFSSNIKTGILDIKVCSPLLNGDAYFIFECKRFNKKIADKYITEGVLRFINEQYYPETNTPVAGMISFLESSDDRNEISASNSYDAIQYLLEKYENDVNLIAELNRYHINCPNKKEIEEYQFIYKSVHKRVIRNYPILIAHIVLDYNHLIN
ncbi:hypothetical protein [Marinifilum sp.]|uniref:hypothetical protein n=1 Tax=Marinifilum sp. TaxID=2033137 RepID=UPI003BAC11F8